MPRALVAQDESRRLIETLLSPWRVTRWDQNDFGIDGVVEIASPVPDSPDHEASGRLFAIQLKATDDPEVPLSLRVSTGHLRYWLNHSLPVLLVSAHLPKESLRARWIDGALLLELRERSPTLWTQDTVTVNMESTVLSAASRATLEAAVLQFRKRELVIPPSRFFQMRDRVLSAAAELMDIGSRSGVETAALLVRETRRTLEASAYAVAVSGPQRVGKSTLVNALIGANISPVADYPTTAVPLVFEPGDRPEALVIFADGSELPVQASAEALRPYAAQQENDANDKNVRLIRVFLPNDLLARGISLVDTPGLHDASSTVREVTQVAMDHADAVLYVLDASLAGKFKLGHAEVEDLRSLQRSKERLLIVLNQADELSGEQRDSLKVYVERQLQRHGLLAGLPALPLFVSGRAAWEARLDGSAPPELFARLEDELWGHLLRHRGTGFHRLASAVGKLAEACAEVEAMLAERADKGVEAGDLERARDTCSTAIQESALLLNQWGVEFHDGVRDYFKRSFDLRVSTLRAELRTIPPNGDPPRVADVQNRLREEIHADAQAVVSFVREQLSIAGKHQVQIVRRALADSRARLGIPQELVFEVPTPTISGMDLSLPEAQLGFWTGLLGFILNPTLGLATTLLGWLVGADVARTKRRARVGANLVRRYEKALADAHARLLRTTMERARSGAQSIALQVRGRLETFVSDAERRIARLGAPLDPDSAARLREIASEIEPIRASLRSISVELARVTADE